MDPTSSTSIIFKITRGDDISRFALDAPTVAQLRARVGPESGILRFLDPDGDWVTLATDADLAEAISCGQPVRLRFDSQPVPLYDAVSHSGVLDAPAPPSYWGPDEPVGAPGAFPAPDAGADADYVVLEALSSSSSSSDEFSDDDDDDDDDQDDEDEDEEEAGDAGASQQDATPTGEVEPFSYPLDMDAARSAGISATEEEVNEVLRALNTHPAQIFAAGFGDIDRVPRDFRKNVKQMLRAGRPGHHGGRGRRGGGRGCGGRGYGGPPGGPGHHGGPPGGYGGPGHHGGPPGGFGGPGHHGGPPGGFGGRGRRCGGRGYGNRHRRHGGRGGHQFYHEHGAGPVHGPPARRGWFGSHVGGMARLVPEDEKTLPVVEAGATYTATWTVRNDSATRAWPEGVVITPGRSYPLDREARAEAGVVLAPGETGQLTVQLTAPTRLGLHFGFWRLQMPGGERRFGCRLPLLLEVVAPGSSSQGSEVLRRLASAGYGDAQTNIALLHRRKGVVTAVIRDLASQQYEAERRVQREAHRQAKQEMKAAKRAAKEEARQQKRAEKEQKRVEKEQKRAAAKAQREQ